jgi:iron complex outermembrane receptor protein
MAFAAVFSLLLPASLALAWQAKEGSAESAEEIQKLTRMSLEELSNVEINVVAPTKQPVPLREAPAIISVITDEEIKRLGYQTVGEALRQVPGLAQFDNHVTRNIGVRGFYSSAGMDSDIVKLMVNGQSVDFSPISGNWFDFDLIDIRAVKRIEVLRGPASALYGANAFLGAINVVTYTPEEWLPRGTWVRAYGDGSWMANPRASTGNGTGAVEAAVKLGPVAWSFAGVLARRDRSGLVIPGLADIQSATPRGYPSPGWFAQARQNFLTNNESQNDLATTGSAYTVARTDIGRFGALKLDSLWQYRDERGEWADDSTLTHENRVALWNMFARLLYESPARERGLEGNLAVTFGKGGPLGADRIVSELNAGSYSLRDFGYRAWHFAGEGRYRFGSRRSLSLGAEINLGYQNLLTLIDVNRDTGIRAPLDGYGERTFSNRAGYGQLIWDIVPNFNVVVGARFDNNSVVPCDHAAWNCFGSQRSSISPLTSQAQPAGFNEGGLLQMSNRLALVYAPELAAYALKLAYGSSFKPPTPLQLYNAQATLRSTAGDPHLKPQTADTIEGGVNVRAWNSLVVTASGFYLLTRNLVSALKEGSALEVRNFNGRSAGGELTLDYGWRDRLFVGANLGYLILGDVTPLRKESETEFVWARSVFNRTRPIGQYPHLAGGLRSTWLQPSWHLSLAVSADVVGARNSSIQHTQFYSSADPERTYVLAPYALVRAHLRSVGLHPLGTQRETVVSLTFQGVTGSAIESGYGGVDIPALGPQVMLGVSQEL